MFFYFYPFTLAIHIPFKAMINFPSSQLKPKISLFYPICKVEGRGEREKLSLRVEREKVRVTDEERECVRECVREKESV